MDNNKNTAMLRAVYSALELNHSDALEANLVNEMGRNLGLTADDVTKLSEQWQSEGLINLHWGPKLSLTPKGRDKATDASPSGSVYIGSNAIVVTAPIGSNAAVGHHASTGPVKIEVGNCIGDLVAALASLHQIENQLNPEEQETAKALTDEMQSVLQETTTAEKTATKPDKASLEKKLDRANGLMEKLGKMSESAIKLKPILDSLGAGIAWIAKTYLMI